MSRQCQEEAKYPEERSGPAAIDGTHSHTLLEHCIKAGLADPTLMVGVRLMDDEGEFVIDADRAARSKWQSEYVKSRVTQLNGMAEVVPENVLILNGSLVGRSQWHRGHPDRRRRCAGDRGLQGWYGRSARRRQLAAGSTLWASWQSAAKGYNVPDQYPWYEVRMTIIQPKLALRGGTPITMDCSVVSC